MTEKVTIYHTNDIHSHLENWPKLEQALLTAKDNKKPDETVYTFDLGDFVDRWHPLTEASQGKANVELMNGANYDAVTIGNNEGVSSSKAELDELYTKANFKVILSNLYDQSTGTYPEWASPFNMFWTKFGTRIGVMACTIPLNISYEPMGWFAENPEESIQKMLETYRDKVDILILLSHLGIGWDREIAEKYPIDVIIGAHTHHALEEGEERAGTLIAAAGRYGEYLGKIELDIDDHEISQHKAELLVTATDLDPVINEEELTASYREVGSELLQKNEIAHLPKGLSSSWLEQSEFVDVGLRAVAENAGTDLAILNAGLFLIPLLSGVVTDFELHQALPHPMRVLKCTLNGSDFIEMIHSMERQREKLRNLDMTGLGFRGKIFGEICYKDIEVKEDETVYVLGQPVQPDQTYTFATVDHYLFAPFFPTIQRKGDNEILFPDFLRTVVRKYLKNHFPIEK